MLDIRTKLQLSTGPPKKNMFEIVQAPKRPRILYSPLDIESLDKARWQSSSKIVLFVWLFICFYPFNLKLELTFLIICYQESNLLNLFG
jgi:hypothetical protein